MLSFLLVLGLLVLPGFARGQIFNFYTNGLELSIYSYQDLGGHNMVIPATTNGYTITRIENNAFLFASLITNAVIPNTVQSIGDYAFNTCIRLKTVSLPASVTNMGRIVFSYCIQMTNISVDAANPAFSSVGGILFDKAQRTLVEFPCAMGGNYVVPSSVTNIAIGAFSSSGIASVSIPSGVIFMGTAALSSCVSLTNIAVDPANPVFTSAGGVLFDKAKTMLLQYPCALGSNYDVPAGVLVLREDAFAYSGLRRLTFPESLNDIEPEVCYSCTNLASIVIPRAVTNLSADAFAFCTNLTAAYFAGNAPRGDSLTVAQDIFYGNPTKAYYLPGTTGWPSNYSEAPTVLWNPQASAPHFTGSSYGFNLTGPTNVMIVVEACTNLSQPVWVPVGTNMFSSGGTAVFSDSQAGNYAVRYYRMRSP